MPLKPIYNNNFSFIEVECSFEHYWKFKTRKYVEIGITSIIKFVLFKYSYLLAYVCSTLKMRCSISNLT